MIAKHVIVSFYRYLAARNTRDMLCSIVLGIHVTVSSTVARMFFQRFF